MQIKKSRKIIPNILKINFRRCGEEKRRTRLISGIPVHDGSSHVSFSYFSPLSLLPAKPSTFNSRRSTAGFKPSNQLNYLFSTLIYLPESLVYKPCHEHSLRQITLSIDLLWKYIYLFLPLEIERIHWLCWYLSSCKYLVYIFGR